MTEGDIRRLQSALPDLRLLRDIPLRDLTTIRTGGPARLFMEAASEKEICTALSAAQGVGIPALVMGAGSNILFADEGYEGLIIHCSQSFSGIRVVDSQITAQAGAKLSQISGMAMRHGLSGFEFASGIPGSVGGAALMNAGAFGADMSRIVCHVACADRTGQRRELSGEGIGYGYRNSLMMREGLAVLSVTLKLTHENPELIERRVEELQARRRLTQPLQIASAGSFFKRPESRSAAELIDRAGLKGFRIGGAEVSTVHAGFFVNCGGATTADFLSLMSHVQWTVKDREGIELTPEIRIIGRMGT